MRVCEKRYVFIKNKLERLYCERGVVDEVLDLSRELDKMIVEMQKIIIQKKKSIIK